MTAVGHQDVLAGDGIVARLLRTHDWSGSQLGHPRQWPQSLRSVASLVLDSKLSMFVAWGPQLAVIYNDAFIELLGAKHPAALGQPHLEIWAEARAGLEPYVQRALAGESLLLEEVFFTILRKESPEDVWVTFSYAPVRDESGAVAGIHCVCIEATAAVLVARSKLVEQERLQTLFQQTPGFFAVLRGPQHVFDSVNHAYLQLVGFRDVIGKSVAQALPEVVEQGFVGLLDSVRASGEPFVGRSTPIMLSRSKDAVPTQAYVDFIFQPLRDAADRIEGILVQGHEVTERHQAQEALLAFSNSIPAIAWVAGVDGQLERFNSQWQAYTGVDAQSALGRGWVVAVHPQDLQRAGEGWRAARGGNQPWQVEYRLRGAGGGWRWFRAHAVPQLDAAGAVLRWFGTTTDIEESRRSDQTLRDADRQKDEFLATLAHELRNPLAPIRSAVQLLSAAGTTEAVRMRATEVISRQVGHMAHLLDDLIDVSRITQRRLALKTVPVLVEAAVAAAVEAGQPLCDAKKHALTVQVHLPAGTRILADPVRLTQVLSNLLHNACKYTDPSGHVALEVTREGAMVVFSVTDNGIGLTAEAITSVFAMFAQEQAALDRSEGGLGIGLALVKGLVELHGGHVSARSAGLGHGSRFEVTMPVFEGGVEAGAAPAPEMELPQAQPVAARTVLLADDNRDALDVLAELLRMDGHTVHVASDGQQALEMALALRPAVVVLDIGMPGLNGYEVARRIRAATWPVRPMLIAATGWGQEGDRQSALAAGFDSHLTKPFDPSVLLRLIAG